jgi:hypothetical protein
MVSQQLKVYAPHVAQRCLELGRHNPDYNIGIQHGLDISTDWISSPLVVYHTKQAIVTSAEQNRLLFKFSRCHSRDMPVPELQVNKTDYCYLSRTI